LVPSRWGQVLHNALASSHLLNGHISHAAACPITVLIQTLSTSVLNNFLNIFRSPPAQRKQDNEPSPVALMVRKKISYLLALAADLSCRGTEDSISGAPDAKLTMWVTNVLWRKGFVALVFDSLL